MPHADAFFAIGQRHAREGLSISCRRALDDAGAVIGCYIYVIDRQERAAESAALMHARPPEYGTTETTPTDDGIDF